MVSRSLRRGIPLLVLLLFLAPAANAQVLLSNFTGTTAAAVGPLSAARVDKTFRLASGISVSGGTDFRFTSLQVSLSNVDNVAFNFFGGIYSDVSGNPGVRLSDFVPVSVPGLTDPASTFAFEATNPFTLGAGSTYWFVLQLDVVSTGTGWNVSSPGVAPTGISDVTWAGQRFTIDGGETWANDVDYQPYRMQVNGTPISTVPEPSTFALFGASLAGLVLYPRRRRR